MEARLGKNIPSLDDRGKAQYVERHLFNELRWLLGAATEWAVQDQLKLELVGYDVRVYAMDSAFVHARSLFEFFLKPTNRNHYGSNEFLGGTVLVSNSYTNDWKDPLHAFLMHAQDRSSPRPLNSSGEKKDLNRLPVDFAHEVLRLWKEFEEALGKSTNPADRNLQKLGREKGEEAIRDAKWVVDSDVGRQHARQKGQRLTPVFGSQPLGV